MTREDCIEKLVNEDETLLFMDGYDDAILGVVYDTVPRVAYDYEKIIIALCKDMSLEEALGFYGYNVERALPYYGASAPVVVYT